MENSAVVNQTGPLCPVGSALRVPPLGYRMVKRAFDLTAALILSVLLAVPAAILMLLIRRDRQFSARSAWEKTESHL